MTGRARLLLFVGASLHSWLSTNPQYVELLVFSAVISACVGVGRPQRSVTMPSLLMLASMSGRDVQNPVLWFTVGTMGMMFIGWLADLADDRVGRFRGETNPASLFVSVAWWIEGPFAMLLGAPLAPLLAILMAIQPSRISDQDTASPDLHRVGRRPSRRPFEGGLDAESHDCPSGGHPNVHRRRSLNGSAHLAVAAQGHDSCPNRGSLHLERCCVERCCALPGFEAQPPGASFQAIPTNA